MEPAMKTFDFKMRDGKTVQGTASIATPEDIEEMVFPHRKKNRSLKEIASDFAKECPKATGP